MWLMTQFRSMPGPALIFAASTLFRGSEVESTVLDGAELQPDSKTNVNSTTTQSLTSVWSPLSRLIYVLPYSIGLRNYFGAVAISTRRFSALPLAVALSATGRLAPKPWGARRLTSTRCAFSQAMTEIARFCESVWLCALFP